MMPSIAKVADDVNLGCWRAYSCGSKLAPTWFPLIVSLDLIAFVCETTGEVIGHDQNSLQSSCAPTRAARGASPWRGKATTLPAEAGGTVRGFGKVLGGARL